jgi:hypothetical protein
MSQRQYRRDVLVAMARLAGRAIWLSVAAFVVAFALCNEALGGCDHLQSDGWYRRGEVSNPQFADVELNKSFYSGLRYREGRLSFSYASQTIRRGCSGPACQDRNDSDNVQDGPVSIGTDNRQDFGVISGARFASKSLRIFAYRRLDVTMANPMPSSIDRPPIGHLQASLS